MKRRTLSGLPHRTIGVAEFKARCLELIEAVGTRGAELTITKRGQPIARVTPISRVHQPLRGILRDRLTIHGDIVQVDWTKEWQAAR